MTSATADRRPAFAAARCTRSTERASSTCCGVGRYWSSMSMEINSGPVVDPRGCGGCGGAAWIACRSVSIASLSSVLARSVVLARLPPPPLPPPPPPPPSSAATAAADAASPPSAFQERACANLPTETRFDSVIGACDVAPIATTVRSWASRAVGRAPPLPRCPGAAPSAAARRSSAASASADPPPPPPPPPPPSSG